MVRDMNIREVIVNFTWRGAEMLATTTFSSAHSFTQTPCLSAGTTSALDTGQGWASGCQKAYVYLSCFYENYVRKNMKTTYQNQKLKWREVKTRRRKRKKQKKICYRLPLLLDYHPHRPEGLGSKRVYVLVWFIVLSLSPACLCGGKRISSQNSL